MPTRWVEKRVDQADVAKLVACGESPLFARLLAQRGIVPEERERFFNPSLKNLPDPTELRGVAEAADEVLSVIRSGGHIVVFGDYDCDGVSATAIMIKTLRAISSASGATVSSFIPNRISEGYGMNSASVARMLSENPKVSMVLSVDNGINSVKEVAELKSRGVAVVVTDHHLPGAELPDCTIINPKCTEEGPLSGLCGAGVAFFLARQLVRRATEEGLYDGHKIGGSLLVLAALATVTDIMPIQGVNRILVAEGLAHFFDWSPIGLKELHNRAARNAVVKYTTKDFGFLIGPRINAAGRIASGTEALDLMLCDEREKARELALSVDLKNDERRRIEKQMTERAMEQIVPGAPAQIISLPGGHPGVAGIVAARVLEEISSKVPVCVAVDSHGSARAPKGYNLRDAFEASASALDRFGGHAVAGGFSVKSGALEEFKRLFSDAVAAQAAVALESDTELGAEEYDAEIKPEELTEELVDSLSAFAPCGEANEEPVFAMRGLRLAELRSIGMDGAHLAFKVCPYGASIADARSVTFRGVWWKRGAQVEDLRQHSAQPFTAYFSPIISDYDGRHVELALRGLEGEDGYLLV